MSHSNAPLPCALVESRVLVAMLPLLWTPRHRLCYYFHFFHLWGPVEPSGYVAILISPQLWGPRHEVM